MAWIESHQSLQRHPKVIRLKTRLEIPKTQAIGLLHCLWWWAMDYAPSGDLSAFTPLEISEAAEWTGDPEAFLRALKVCSLVDKDNRIHDWMEYAGRLILRRENDCRRKKGLRETGKKVADGQPDQAAEMSTGSPQEVRKMSAGSPQEVRKVSAGSPQEVRRKSAGSLTDICVPNPTLPNPTQPVDVDLLKSISVPGEATAAAVGGGEGDEKGGNNGSDGKDTTANASGATPTLEEVLAAATVSAIPPEVCRAFWDSREREGWKNRSGFLMNTREWAADLRCFWTRWQANEAEKKARASRPPTATMSPALARMNLESQRKALLSLIETHPANPDSASSVSDPTQAQCADYREKKKRVRQITEQLAAGVCV